MTTSSTPDILNASTDFTKLDDYIYAAFLHPDMCIGEVPHGGYVATIFLKVAKVHLCSKKHPDTFKADWQFMDRTHEGLALLWVNEIKLGNAISVLHISLHQQGILSQHPWIVEKDKSRGSVAAYITNGSFDYQGGMTLSTGWNIGHEPAEVDFKKLQEDADPNWTRYMAPLMEAVPVLRVLEFFLQRTGHPSPSVQDFWARTASGRPFSNETLAFVADALAPFVLEPFRSNCTDSLPPSAFFPFETTFWCPTLTMGLDVKRRLPAHGECWLRVRISLKQIMNGRFDVELLVFDTYAELLAISHHCCLVVDLEKSFKERHEKL